MPLRFATFTDPLYHAEKEVEFDAAQVAAIEEREVALFLRGRFWVTYVTLRSGAELALKGRVAAQIEAAQSEAAHKHNEAPRGQTKGS